MVKRKILFGFIVFLSLAFLAACGGGSSGSSGAAGTAGTSGSDGTAGTIAVPTDADLVLAANAAVDTNIAIGTILRGFNLSGADALAVDSRQRYYVYEGSSATAKSNAWNNASGLTFTNGNTAYQVGTATSTGMLDTRGIALGDNITITANAVALRISTGGTTHMIVCPGNEAGDAIVCASAALNDRGKSATMIGAAGDNASIVNFVWGTSIIRAAGGNYVGVDTLTIPTDKSTVIADSGTSKSANIGTASQAPGVTSLAVSDTYMVGWGDNNTSIKTINHTAATLTPVAHGGVDFPAAITDMSITEGFGSTHYVVVQNGHDNLSVFSIATNGSLSTFNDNYTDLKATGGTILHGPGESHCSAANPRSAEVVTANWYDNATAGMTLRKWSASGITRNLIAAANGADNATFANICDAAWVNDGSHNGKLYVVHSDNATGYDVCVSVDNGTTCGSYVNGPHGAAGAGGHFALTTDPQTYQPIVAFNKAGDIYVDRYDNTTSTWENLIYTGATNISHATADTVSVTTSGNDHVILGFQHITGDNSTVIVFYDN